jgi:hypothetical protein
LFNFYFFNTELIKNWLEDLWWMDYASFTITAIIAWQFSRSRMVYAYFLVFFIATGKELTLTPEMLEVRYNGTLFGFILYFTARIKDFMPSTCVLV